MEKLEFMFWKWRGHKVDIEKLKEKVEEIKRSEGDCTTLSPELVKGDIYELVFTCDKMLTLVEMFPQLKATGFVEDWKYCSGYLYFSDVGQTTCETVFIDYFDGKAWERWTFDDPTISFCKVEIDIRTGDEWEVGYEFYFKDEWEKDNY